MEALIPGQTPELFRLLKMLGIGLARRALVESAQCGGAADTDAHHANGLHHANGAERIAVDADVAPRHEQVIDIARVKAAVGNGIADALIDTVTEDRFGDERMFWIRLAVAFLGNVKVDRPSRQHAAIGEGGFFLNVIAREDDIAEQLLGLARAADVSEPGHFRVSVGMGIACGVRALVFHGAESTVG